MRSRLPFLINQPTHTVIFCFPPPTLNTPSNPSYTPNYKNCRLCSDDKDFETKPALEMRTIFVDRGYPTHPLKAFSISRRDTLKPPLDKLSDYKIPLVLIFHPF